MTVVPLLLALLLLAAPWGAEAKRCKSGPGREIWRHNDGYFKMNPNSDEWVEYDKGGKPGSRFVVTQVEGQNIVMHSEERQIDILMRDDLAGLRHKGEESFQKLYDGKFLQILDCTHTGMVLRRTAVRLHGLLCAEVGDRALPFGHDLVPLLPSNNVFHSPARLRANLDRDGYLYLKNIVPREAIAVAFADVTRQLQANGWAPGAEAEAEMAKHGFINGIVAPTQRPLPDPTAGFAITEPIQRAACGTNVMAAVRQVFGGPVTLLNYHTLELSYPGEGHGFSMPAVGLNQGTKLLLQAWVPLHDIPVTVGGQAVVVGSNSAEDYALVRQTYGQHEVETGDIRGDGSFSSSTDEILSHRCPLATTGFEAGDLLLTTVYTMQTALKNVSRQWRVAASSRWIMEGDDVGPDPRYVGASPRGLSQWAANRDNAERYPRTMAEAKAEWGLQWPKPEQ